MLRRLDRFIAALTIAPFRFVYRHADAIFFGLMLVTLGLWAFAGHGGWPRFFADVTLCGALMTSALALGGSFGRQEGRESERLRILRIVDAYDRQLGRDVPPRLEQKARTVATGIVRDALGKP